MVSRGASLGGVTGFELGGGLGFLRFDIIGQLLGGVVEVEQRGDELRFVTLVILAPLAGLIVYTGDLFPQWKGDALIPALSGEALVRVDVNGTNAAKGDQWPMNARIREVEEGPDGAIWVLQDGANAKLLKLTPRS